MSEISQEVLDAVAKAIYEARPRYRGGDSGWWLIKDDPLVAKVFYDQAVAAVRAYRAVTEGGES